MEAQLCVTETLTRLDGYPRGRSSRERGMPDARCSSSALFSSQSSQSVADAEVAMVACIAFDVFRVETNVQSANGELKVAFGVV